MAWYNAQFYCGWGDVGRPGVWEVVSGGGRWGRGRVVVGLVTRWVQGVLFCSWVGGEFGSCANMLL